MSSARRKPTHGIAVVDDETAVRVTLRHIINSIDGFQCCGEYASGEAALSGIPGSTTRAVFMDLKMPGMTGLDCTRRLLALMPELRVIIATACVDPDILLACYRAGASHHLIKPFSLMESERLDVGRRVGRQTLLVRLEHSRSISMVGNRTRVVLKAMNGAHRI